MARPQSLERGEEIRLRSLVKQQFEMFSRPLPAEKEIVHQWPDDSPVMVSIVCAVYNHAHLVEDAIISFLHQETDFRFEIILRDDASTDGSQEVLRQYEHKYPSIIRLKLNEENQFSKGWRALYDFPALIEGKYVAICQGDDFWVSTTKLQRQVDQLESLPSCVMSMGGTIMFDVVANLGKETGNVEEAIVYSKLPDQYFHPSAYLVRAKPWAKIITKYFIPSGIGGDTPLRKLLIHDGCFAACPGVMSVYWINGLGIWTSLGSLKKVMWEFRSSWVALKAFPLANARSEIPSLIKHGHQVFILSFKERAFTRCIRFIPFSLMFFLARAPSRLRRLLLSAK